MQERGDDIGNSISAEGMQIEAHAREGEREKERGMDEGGREGAFWVECGRPLITSAT